MPTQSLSKQEQDTDLISSQIESVVKVFDSAFFDCRLSRSIQLKPKQKKGFSLGFEKNFLFFGPSLFELCSDLFVLSILHEMVHAHNLIKGVRDVGRNSYHNKRFSSECSRVGAFVVKHNNTGWSILSLYPPRNVTEENSVIIPEERSHTFFVDLVCNMVNDFNWELFYKCSSSLFARPKDYTYKYTCLCPPPYNSIRSGRGPDSNNPLKVQCIECGSVFSCKSR